ncbi:Gtr1/RagA G protein conserved region-domain-containing protein [Pelagophyceae sp. CCMP2097]|nr:Gtr1/RagA G protein conserved region-domain-containing protein [Pelagophyceae sp. CCMP2097]|mmetsp:Transcript_24881/g.88814  ORF Transcript_24881/g.88814 Transcript_24881/m.88814 type:complete len:302 (+) Transcript_24881:200-1105(+)
MSDSKKVLLMGRSGSGKTSMRSIIFADYLARDTMRLSPTIDVEYSHVRFLGNLHLHLWDCGGQDDFYRNYLENMRDHIFRSVEVLIYVFDIESEEAGGDLTQYSEIVEALEQHSPDARVYVLVHKMDLIKDEVQSRVFAEREAQILRFGGSLNVRCFRTSIWDETLYHAWSHIVYSLVPNTALLESHLTEFCGVCGADEVVLFELTTFLVIAHATLRPHSDVHRFEKISNIIKQFKLSCRKAQAQFEGMLVRNGRFTALFDLFTKNTCIMVVLSDASLAHTSTLKTNVAHFRVLMENIRGD